MSDGRVDVRKITEDRLTDWKQDCVNAHATPVLLIAVGHDEHAGQLHIITLDESSMDNKALAGFLRFALAQLEQGNYQEENGVMRGVERGVEIQAWLDKHPGVASYVILDDGDDMGQLRPRLVRTDYRIGLTHAHVEQALRLLRLEIDLARIG